MWCHIIYNYEVMIEITATPLCDLKDCAPLTKYVMLCPKALTLFALQPQTKVILVGASIKALGK